MRMRIVRANNTERAQSSRRSKRKIAAMDLSEGQILPYYTKGTSRTKIRPSHVKIIIFRPLIWAVDDLYTEEEEEEEDGGFLGLRKIVACSQPYLAVASCIYSFWHGVIPTSYS